MPEIVDRLSGGFISNAIKLFLNRSRLKIICGMNLQPNVDGVGTYLAMWVKIINPTSSPIYFERIEAIDETGDSYFPSFYGVQGGKEIAPKRNIVGLIPCGHIASIKPTKLIIYDSTEKKYTLRGTTFREVVNDLIEEKLRLEKLNCSVHPSYPYPE